MNDYKHTSEDVLLKLADLASRGLLDAEGYIQLDEMLSSSRSNLKAYVEYLHLHVKLSEMTSEHPSESAVRLRLKDATFRRSDVARYLIVSVLPFILLGIGLLSRVKIQESLVGYIPKEPETVASVRSMTSATEWSISGHSQVSRIQEGQTISVTEGAVELSFFKGARMLLEGPAEIQVTDGANVVLKSGKLKTTILSRLTGFRVQTDSLEVVDLGTEFFVDATQYGLVTAFVSQGECEVANVASTSVDRNRYSLKAGHCGLADAMGELVLLDELRSIQYGDRLMSCFAKYDAKVASYSPSVCIGTLAQAERGDDSPNRFAYLIPERRGIKVAKEIQGQDGSEGISPGTIVDSYLLYFTYGESVLTDTPATANELTTSGTIVFQKSTAAVVPAELPVEIFSNDDLSTLSQTFTKTVSLETQDTVRFEFSKLMFRFSAQSGDTDCVRILVQSASSG